MNYAPILHVNYMFYTTDYFLSGLGASYDAEPGKVYR